MCSLNIPCRFDPLAGIILSGQQPYWVYKQQPIWFGPCAAVILSSQHPNCSLAHGGTQSKNLLTDYISNILFYCYVKSESLMYKLLINVKYYNILKLILLRVTFVMIKV